MGASYSSMTPISAGGLFVDVSLDAEPANKGLFGALLILLAAFILIENSLFHVPYSKFAKEDALQDLPANFLHKLFAMQMDARLGFFILYFIPLITYIIMWACFAAENMRNIGHVAASPTYSILLFVGWTLSFSKRCLEVLFVHIYSGRIPIFSTALIALGYSSAGLVANVYSNQIIGYDAFGVQTRAKDIVCVVFYVIGITVNLIAHYQLRLVRIKGDSESIKRYFAPAEIGVLFKIFICPHYVFEIIMFAAWAFFGATSIHYMVGITILLYLGGRTMATRRWYEKKGLLRNSSSQKTGLLSSNPQYQGGDSA